MSSWTTLPNYSVGQPLSVSKMDQTMDNFIVAGCHGHTGAMGDGGVVSGSMLRGSSGIQTVEQYITIMPFITTCYTLNPVNASLFIDSTSINGGWRTIGKPGGTIGASATWLTSLDKGTWTISFYYAGNTNGGFVSACIGGTLAGCVDTYRGSTTRNILSPASNFTISSSGEYTISLVITGSPTPPPGNIEAWIHHIELRRLSA